MEEGADVEESEEAAEEAAPKKKPKGKGKANTSSPQPPAPSRSVRASPLRDAKRMEDAEKEKKKKKEAASKRKLADISEAPSVDDLPDTWDDDFDPSLLVCVSVCISIRTVVL